MENIRYRIIEEHDPLREYDFITLQQQMSKDKWIDIKYFPFEHNTIIDKQKALDDARSFHKYIINSGPASITVIEEL